MEAMTPKAYRNDRQQGTTAISDLPHVT